ncbi:cation-transporting ATPase [Labedella gwakjiensis]|uniref:Cation-transporting ATPase n=1 Tax=Labedella gwakjiensis TaxID=390269 RepID=A0ABY0C6U0_9MICO|nr:cation-transporting ATPase [Labedella gwakjiensis]RUQ84695.1 cation-transporting ATPase [Labedella gwakjiensis]
MPDFKRLLGAAAKALGDSSSSSSPTNQRNGSSTDWKNIVRTAADKLTGDEQNSRNTPRGGADSPSAYRPTNDRWSGGAPAGRTSGSQPTEADRIALGKYDYLLQTAPPGQLEQVHHEAFERLTPAQRQQLQDRLTEELPAHERPLSGSTGDLARAATRGETAHPGLMKRVFDARRSSSGRGRSGMGSFATGAAAGAGVAAIGGIALTVAGAAAVSSVAGPLLSNALASGVDFGGLADGFGFEGIAGLTEGVGGLTEGVDGLAQSGEEYVGGLGDQLGEAAQGFEIPGLGDLFGR